MYKKAEASFWTAEEINLLADLVDWTRLSDTEPHFLAHVLAFCTTSDGIVNENLSSNFTTKVTAPKARCIYGIQITVGNIHSKMYFLLINTYLKDCQGSTNRNYTCSTPSGQYHVSNAKPTGL